MHKQLLIKILSIVKKIEIYLESKMINADNKKDEITPSYEDLLPYEYVKEPVYEQALDYALNNKKIKNIALMGPYGSGKSSILSSYKKKRSFNSTWLDISLATFNLSEGTSSEGTIDEEKLERSILQQMFYRVDGKQIPYSRFRRIVNIKKKTIVNWIISLGLLLISLSFLFRPNELLKIIDPYHLLNLSNLNDYAKYTIYYFVLCGTIVLSAWIAYNIFYFFIRRMKISKISLKDATIEEKSLKKDSSVFNQYIDEILYFFTTTDFDTIVFEDLDRFNSLNIFESLRELNFLLNNSEQVQEKHERVVFIYALKDDIFGEVDSIAVSRNRTKFFDFVIPIIPIVNSYNSKEIMTKKLEAAKITPRYMEQITYYIDDMRMLINICNEFHVYTSKQKEKGLDLNPNKLLGMIIYKNIYPIDFSRLQFNSGMVYDTFNQKDNLIAKIEDKNNHKIDTLQSLIEKTDEEIAIDINELQQLYAGAIGLLSDRNGYHIQINNTRYYKNDISSMFENLKKLNDNNSVSAILPSGSTYTNKKQLQTAFNTKPSYFVREADVINKSHIEEYRKQVEELKKRKMQLHHFTLKEILDTDESIILDTKIKSEGLLIYLTTEGLIDETYERYFSIFHQGSITAQDENFVLSILDHKPKPYNYRLDDPKTVIEKLSERNFQQRASKNYYLLRFLLESDESKLVKFILKQVRDDNDNVLFIDEFIFFLSGNQGLNVKNKFFNILGQIWSDFWNQVYCNSEYTDLKKTNYLQQIIQFCSVDDIIKMNDKKNISEFLSTEVNILSFIDNVNNNDKLHSLLRQVIICVKSLSKDQLDNDKYELLLDTNSYEINPKNIQLFIDMKSDNNRLLEPTYTNVLKWGDERLFQYIKANIDDFTTNVLLNLNPYSEDEKSFIELIKIDELENKLKKQLIKNQRNVLNKITLVPTEFWGTLIQYLKVNADINTLLYYYNQFEIDDCLLDFLNQEANIQRYLMRSRNIIIEEQIELYKKISNEIVFNERINIPCFELLIKYVIFEDKYDLPETETKRLQILVAHNCIKRSTENYINLKKYKDKLHLMYLENNVDLINDVKLDSTEEISFLLESDKLSMDKKQFVINSIHSDNFIGTCQRKVIGQIVNLWIKHKVTIPSGIIFIIIKYPDIVNEELLVSIFVSEITKYEEGDQREIVDKIIELNLMNSEKSLLVISKADLDVRHKIELTNAYINNIDVYKLDQLFKNVGSGYADLLNTRNQSKLPIISYNERLINSLVNRGYISSKSKEGNIYRINKRGKNPMTGLAW